jgi:RNA polymerase sigma-70 factor (ECF subfamily)
VEGFETFFEDNYGDVLRSVAFALGDRDRAEDLTQEAFARAYQRWGRVAAMERPVTWVYVVALNAERKRWKRERTEDIEEPGRGESDHASRVVTGVVVRDAVHRLAARQRAAVALRYVSDLTVADIARIMACSEGTVKATLHQALGKLRVDLQGSEP